jgi:hypothetical protein
MKNEPNIKIGATVKLKVQELDEFLHFSPSASKAVTIASTPSPSRNSNRKSAASPSAMLPACQGSKRIMARLESSNKKPKLRNPITHATRSRKLSRVFSRIKVRIVLISKHSNSVSHAGRIDSATISRLDYRLNRETFVSTARQALLSENLVYNVPVSMLVTEMGSK